eukprot:5450106-Pleurochrysis_carterae.AAC.1
MASRASNGRDSSTVCSCRGWDERIGGMSYGTPVELAERVNARGCELECRTRTDAVEQGWFAYGCRLRCIDRVQLAQPRVERIGRGEIIGRYTARVLGTVLRHKRPRWFHVEPGLVERLFDNVCVLQQCVQFRQ